MSRNARIATVAATVLVAIVALLVLRPGTEEPPPEEPERNGATVDRDAPEQTATSPEQETGATATVPEGDGEDGAEVIRVREGRPVGGARRLRVTRGDSVEIRVTSTDTSDEIHLHGYDVLRDLAPGEPAVIRFEAGFEGIFELELHGTGEKLADVEVRPS
jgi:FtsP/CotA-like multicopper oxidase with cupredoxin domain